ncbi:MAG: hypothetical protein ACHQ2E_07880 [Gemmatimonadales bacterium]
MFSSDVPLPLWHCQHAGRWLLLGGLLVAACSSQSTAPTAPPVTVDCSGQSPLALAPGEHAVLDPAGTHDCLRLPAAGGNGAEYLVVALSTTGQVTTTGISGSYRFAAGPATAAALQPEAGKRPPSVAAAPPSTAALFHAMLRERGRALVREAATARALIASRAPGVVTAPAVGSQRSFLVCGNATCGTTVTVTATASHVGPHGVIYIDNAAPAGGYTQAELDRLGGLFDAYMYPIDTTAFGRETDIDGNGAVAVLLSPAVNHLSGNCNSTGSVIAGFFFPDDLIPGSFGSNSGEVFYGLVPDPANPTCTITHDFALSFIGPTFLHEFQHMISFGRHVLLPPVASNSEDNWLDEGLSRFAEELGGREIPDSFCAPQTCRSEFPNGDLNNAFEYLDKNTLEASPLIEADNIDGTLAQNGANWLVVRWLADHFATDSILGTNLTRALDGADNPGGTVLTGSTNVATITGADFSTLIGEWQLANYLTAVPGFVESSGRLRYKSVNLASIFITAAGYYPLQPDSLASGSYVHSGILRQGSGRHLLIGQPPSGPGVDVALTDPTGAGLGTTLIARIAVARIR